MKIVAISDTHLDHPDMNYWGDVIVHCGDITCRGYENELNLFVKWFSSLNQFNHKIMIPGNRDWIFEDEWEKAENLCKNAGIVCLNDSGIEINQVKFWGSPITPEFCNWAFNRKRGEEIRKHWDLIPENIDILITHGPPSKVGDLSLVKESNWKYDPVKGRGIKVESFKDVGCEDLKQKVDQIKPKYHLFGHIHEGYGIYKNASTTFINCAHMSRNHMSSNPPVEFWI